MKKTIRHLGIILLLCAPLSIAAQDKDPSRVNRERAVQMSTTVRGTLAEKEPQWKFQRALKSESGYRQYFRSEKQELEVTFYVFDSEAEASKRLMALSMLSSVAGRETLSGTGDEAYYMSHPYFSWVGVRKGRMLIEVYGPGPELTVTKRIAQYGLDQMGK